MKEEDLKFIESLCDEKTDSWVWILSILILSLVNGQENKQPTINIYIGDE